MQLGNLLLASVLLLSSLLGCSGGDSACSDKNECVAGYACNKDGKCVPAQPLRVDMTELQDAYVGETYEVPLQASGGIPPYRWTLESDLSWLSVEEMTGDLWVLTGTPDVPTSLGGKDIKLKVLDDSYGNGENDDKSLLLVVHECVDGRKRSCSIPQNGVCMSGFETCSTNSWGICNASQGPSIDVGHCGPDCSPCNEEKTDSCRGGICACGNESPCTGTLICCHHKCMDVPECGDCGDGVRQEWEECEDLDLGNKSCELLGYQSGNLYCTEQCAFDVSDCCGDGTTGESEQCDDQNETQWDGCNECVIADFRINTDEGDLHASPSVGIDENGNLAVAWISFLQDGSGKGVFGRRLDANGAPLGADFQINTFTEGDQSYPSLSMSPSGKFVVVWDSFDQDGSYAGVFGQIFDSQGNRMGTEFQVNTTIENNQNMASVGMAPDSSFVVVWVGPDPQSAYDEIFGQRYDSNGNRIGSEFRISISSDYYKEMPKIALDGSGNFVVAWMSQHQDGSLTGIYGRRFDTEGNPLGDEFRINSFTEGEQWEHNVAMDKNGNFMLVWQSAEQDGSGFGIFAQMYNSEGNTVGGEFQVNPNVA